MLSLIQCFIGAIGSLDYTSEERKILAKKSLSYSCSVCKIDNSTVLPILTEKSQEISAEAKNLATQIEFKNKKQETTSESPAVESPVESLAEVSSTIQSNENTNEVFRRIQQSSSTSLSSSSSLNRSLSDIRTELSGNNSSYLFIISILCAIFLFLFIRRIYLLMDAPFPI